MRTTAAKLILNSRTMSETRTHYARITAAASGMPEAIVFGRFLYCQAIQPELMRRFVDKPVRYKGIYLFPGKRFATTKVTKYSLAAPGQLCVDLTSFRDNLARL